MESLDVDGVLVQSFFAMKVGVMNSTIEHHIAGMGCFAREQIGKRMEIGVYSVKVMYTNPYGDGDVERRHKEGFMSGQSKNSRLTPCISLMT